MKYYIKYPYFKFENSSMAVKPSNMYVYYIEKIVIIESKEVLIIERICGESVNAVTYRFSGTVENMGALHAFHINHYKEVMMRIERRLTERIYFYSNYIDKIFTGNDFISLNENGKDKISYTLNKNFELSEYRETFYDDLDEAIVEKHFFPKQWKIDIEELQ